MLNKRLSIDQARLKIQAYCAYQERSHKEVREKLYGYGLYKSDVDVLLSELIQENFLNEERFAQAFATGKFNIKKWGWCKIEIHLKQKGVSTYCIQSAKKVIDDRDYLRVLQTLAEKKMAAISAQNKVARQAKVANFLLGRGFEAELVWQVLNAED